MIAVAPTATEHRPDVAVDGLDFAERDLDVAVGQDAVEVPAQELGDLVEGRQPLPAQGANPGGQEAPRGPLVDVVPEVGQLLLEEMRFGQATVEGQELADVLALAAVEIAPRVEQQPPLAAQGRPGRAALAEELARRVSSSASLTWRKTWNLS